MNTPELAAPPFVQPDDNLFDSPRDRPEIALPIAANVVLPLPDDIAMPAGTIHVPGRIYRLDRYDSIVFFDQGDNVDMRINEEITIRSMRVQ